MTKMKKTEPIKGLEESIQVCAWNPTVVVQIPGERV